MRRQLHIGFRILLVSVGLILLIGFVLPQTGYAQDIPVKTAQKKVKKQRIKPKKNKKPTCIKRPISILI